ncbi:hypothetical protein EB796_006449 [Bugula neritina]|uniref:Uncharacterized protein n=1 Tax=Bugula neritina TaxID=10212 RepID=A0A7J7KAN4_BUGNE|nr:hypothetical protein EB796_006449 [Bugula neritina]
MNVVIDRGVLDTSLERLFPAVRKANSGGANRQERIFCRDPKRLMSGILQDSLEVKASIPEGAEEFWTKLLGRESPVDVPEYNDRQARRPYGPHLGRGGSQIPLSEK